MTDLNKFLEWANQNPNRSVDIHINEYNKPGISAFVYNYKLGVGQRVKTVEEIDLEGEALRQKKAEYERLKAEFEPVKSEVQPCTEKCTA